MRFKCLWQLQSPVRNLQGKDKFPRHHLSHYISSATKSTCKVYIFERSLKYFKHSRMRNILNFSKIMLYIYCLNIAPVFIFTRLVRQMPALYEKQSWWKGLNSIKFSNRWENSVSCNAQHCSVFYILPKFSRHTRHMMTTSSCNSTVQNPFFMESTYLRMPNLQQIIWALM